MLLDPLGAETLDRSQGLHGPGGAAGQLHRLPVIAQDKRGDSFSTGSIPSPLEDPLISHPLHFVQLSEQFLQRRHPLPAPLQRSTVHRLLVSHGPRALQSPGLQKNAPVGPTAMDEELRLRSNHVTLSEVLPQHAVIEHLGRFIPPHRHDSRLDQ